MALPVNCIINFDNPSKTYFPGQAVTGTAVYTFYKVKKVRGIFARFRGTAETKWTTEDHHTHHTHNHHHGGSTTTEIVPHTATEEYFNVLCYLQGGESTDDLVFQPGTHTFPFKYELPMILPTTLEGEYGRIWYTVEVVLDRPWKFNQETKAAFIVVSHVDLNKIPDVERPIEMHMEKWFSCLLGKSGYLTVDIKLPSIGYVSGQMIPIEITCKNDSSVTINMISVKLRKHLIYHSHIPDRSIKESKLTVARFNTEEISGRSAKDISENLEVPAIAPSTLQSCGIIELKYYLEIECKASGMHFDLTGESDIIIGTVALIKFQPTVNEKTDMTSPIVPPLVHVNSDEAGYMRPYDAQPMFKSSLPPSYPGQTMETKKQVLPIHQTPYSPNMAPYPNAGMVNPATLQPHYATPVFVEGKYIPPIPPNVQNNDAPSPYPDYGFAIPPK